MHIHTMPQIHDITDTSGQFTLTPDHTRSTGLHVSQIINDICVDLGYFKRDATGSLVDADRTPIEEVSRTTEFQVFDAVTILRICLGLAWEEWLSAANPHISYHIGEVDLDGIIGTPDGLSTPSTHPDTVVVHEFKVTWRSSRKSPLDVPWLMMQCKAYCALMSTQVVQLHVYYVLGDYTYPLRPQSHVYWIVFSRQEIQENWAMLHRYAVKHHNLKSPLTKDLFSDGI